MVSLFQNITLNEKGKILKLLNTTIFTYQKCVNVSYSFNDSETVGVILEGSLDIVRIDYNGNRTIIDTVYEDELFGSSITSIINNDYEIVTKEEVRILWIDYNHILKNSDNSLEIIQNSLDIFPIVWQNILVDVPLRVLAPDAKEELTSGNGWRLITEDTDEEEIDPRLAKLKDYIKE